jgi:uncharacterized protein YqcC (DUF446 family)
MKPEIQVPYSQQPTIIDWVTVTCYILYILISQMNMAVEQVSLPLNILDISGSTAEWETVYPYLGASWSSSSHQMTQ